MPGNLSRASSQVAVNGLDKEIDVLTKLVFVLVIFGADGSTQRFAEFENAEQCQQFANAYNLNNQNFSRANCMPENVRAEVDFDQAMAKMTAMMKEMKRALNDETVSNQRPTP